MKLEDLCLNITDGKHGDCTPKDGSNIFFISAKDISDGKILYTGARMIDEQSYIEADRRTKLEINDILITNSGTIGKMALIKEIPFKTTFQKSVAIIKPNPQLICPNFLYYQLLAKRNDVIALAQGSTQLNLLLRDIRNIEIKLFPENKQQHIVNTIGSVDDLIEKNGRIINMLEQYSKLIYLTHKKLRTGNLSLRDCCDIKTGKLDANASTEDGAYPFFTCGQDILKIDNYAFDCEAIIISGNGEISVKYYSGKFNAYQRTYVLSPNRLFYLFLEECKLSISDLKNNSQGSVIKFITKGMLEKISVVDDAESIKLNYKLCEMYKLIAKKKKEIENLMHIKKQLLNYYF